ncbi:hypothetical protein DFH09DRAFT_1096445 [Mycena vulgaris]|nr:hypothetical protein DFH09DRAFT_1096445 [Mycena vulgaris]
MQRAVDTAAIYLFNPAFRELSKKINHQELCGNWDRSRFTDTRRARADDVFRSFPAPMMKMSPQLRLPRVKRGGPGNAQKKRCEWTLTTLPRPPANAFPYHDSHCGLYLPSLPELCSLPEVCRSEYLADATRPWHSRPSVYNLKPTNTHTMSFGTSLNAIAVLENPRLIPKMKSIVFDAQIYLGSGQPALIASLRYFNENNHEFADPARTNPTIEVFSQDLNPVDYLILGTYWCFDSAFGIQAVQYLTATRTADNAFPVRCPFPSTPLGEVQAHTRERQYFIVELEKVTFLGQAPVAPKAEESPTKCVTVSQGTPARVKFTGFFGSQESNTKSGGSEPSSKERARQRMAEFEGARKTADDRVLEESEDKGKGTSTALDTRLIVLYTSYEIECEARVTASSFGFNSGWAEIGAETPGFSNVSGE